MGDVKTAALVQRDREAADLENHRDRLAWITGDRPRWADGEPVDAHTRHVLALQSRAAIQAATGSAGE
jgi:hypothetical protein